MFSTIYQQVGKLKHSHLRFHDQNINKNLRMITVCDPGSELFELEEIYYNGLGVLCKAVFIFVWVLCKSYINVAVYINNPLA